MYMNLKYISLKQQHSKTCSFKAFHTCSFEVFHNENWGKISYYPVLPSTAISGSIAQPGKTWVLPHGFSRAVRTLPTLAHQGIHTTNQVQAHQGIYTMDIKTFTLPTKLMHIRIFTLLTKLMHIRVFILSTKFMYIKIFILWTKLMHIKIFTLWTKFGEVGCAIVLGSFQCRGILLLLHIVGQGPAVLEAGAVWRVGYIFHLSSLSNVLSFGRQLNTTEISWFQLLNPNGSCQLLPRKSSLSTS